MRGSASVGRVFKPCGGEKFRRKACVFIAEGRRVFLPQREGVCFCRRGKVCVFVADRSRVFLPKIREGLYDGENESAPGKALS